MLRTYDHITGKSFSKKTQALHWSKKKIPPKPVAVPGASNHFPDISWFPSQHYYYSKYEQKKTHTGPKDPSDPSFCSVTGQPCAYGKLASRTYEQRAGYYLQDYGNYHLTHLEIMRFQKIAQTGFRIWIDGTHSHQHKEEGASNALLFVVKDRPLSLYLSVDQPSVFRRNDKPPVLFLLRLDTFLGPKTASAPMAYSQIPAPHLCS